MSHDHIYECYKTLKSFPFIKRLLNAIRIENGESSEVEIIWFLQESSSLKNIHSPLIETIPSKKCKKNWSLF